MDCYGEMLDRQDYVPLAARRNAPDSGGAEGGISLHDPPQAPSRTGVAVSVVRTVPAGAVAAGLVATAGSGTAGTTALSVVSLLAMLLLLRSARFHLRGSMSSCGRHRRTEP